MSSNKEPLAVVLITFELPKGKEINSNIKTFGIDTPNEIIIILMKELIKTLEKTT